MAKYGMRPCDVIRRDLEGHVTLFAFTAEVVNRSNKQTGCYVDWEWESEFGVGYLMAKYKGVKRGYLAIVKDIPEGFVNGVYLEGPRSETPESGVVVGVPEDQAT